MLQLIGDLFALLTWSVLAQFLAFAIALCYHNFRQLTITIIKVINRNLFNNFAIGCQDLLNIYN